MADLGWLRHFGQRPKTPTISGAAPEEQDYFSTSGMSPHSPTRRIRGPAVRRVSSLLSLVPGEHNASPPLPSPTVGTFRTTHNDTGLFRSTPEEQSINLDSSLSRTTTVGHNEPEAFVREADRIWHNPSHDQIIESLQVAMMNRPSTHEPLPIQYNGHVLALIEGYAKIKQELEETKRTAAAGVEEVKKMRDKEVESYRSLRDEWSEKETNYRAEIKRLELLLAHHTEGGMATVALARAGSVVDRSAKARKRFEERIKRLSRGDVGDGLETAPAEAESEDAPPERKVSVYKHVVSMPMNIDPDHDRRVSQQFKPKRNRSPGHIQFSKKHRRPSNGNESADRQDAAARAQDHDTYVPTGVPPPGGRNGSRSDMRGHGQRAGSPRQQEVSDSSSSSSNAYSSSTTSSEDFRPALKGKGVDRARETRDKDIRWNTEVTRNPTAGEDIGPAQHGNRTMGELAIERFLEDGKVAQDSINGSDAKDPVSEPLGGVTEDYFTQPRAQDQRRRARGFSFIAGDDSLPVSPMAVPGATQLDSNESAEIAKQRASQDSQAIQVSAPPDILQPRPQSTMSHSRGTSVASQLQKSIDTAEPSIRPTAAVPAQEMRQLSVSTTVATPSSLRPTSTGSMVYTGDKPSTAGSRDSTGSRITVLHDSSSRTSRRQSSQSQATSDISFESAESNVSPATLPIRERQGLNPISPTPSTRGSKKKGKQVTRSSMSSTLSSPALAPVPTDVASASRPPTPLLRSSSPSSGRPTLSRRAPSSTTGGSEASVTAGQAARIAATLAVARGQKRRESEHQ